MPLAVVGDLVGGGAVGDLVGEGVVGALVVGGPGAMRGDSVRAAFLA